MHRQKICPIVLLQHNNYKHLRKSWHACQGVTLSRSVLFRKSKTHAQIAIFSARITYKYGYMAEIHTDGDSFGIKSADITSILWYHSPSQPSKKKRARERERYRYLCCEEKLVLLWLALNWSMFHFRFDCERGILVLTYRIAALFGMCASKWTCALLENRCIGSLL